MFKSSEAAKIIGIDSALLRDWRRRGLLHLGKKKGPSSHPTYTPKDVAGLLLVNRLATAGLSLQAAFEIRAQNSYLFDELIENCEAKPVLHIWLDPAYPGEVVSHWVGPWVSDADFDDNADIVIKVSLRKIADRVIQAQQKST